jgi:hypothetical protein
LAGATTSGSQRCGRRAAARTAGKDLADYTLEGDHVIPESMGGTWIGRRGCEACNKHANRIGDELIAHDFLIRLLRSRHQVPDRNNNIPKPPVIALPVNGAGVVKVALTPAGPKYQAGMPPSVIERLELDGPTDQERLSAIVEDALAPLRTPDSDEVRELARRGQPWPSGKRAFVDSRGSGTRADTRSRRTCRVRAGVIS